MKTFAIVSYNIHCNFTNYGSALQSWALSQAIQRYGYKAVLVDYCPECLNDKDPLDPINNIFIITTYTNSTNISVNSSTLRLTSSDTLFAKFISFG